VKKGDIYRNDYWAIFEITEVTDQLVLREFIPCEICSGDGIKINDGKEEECCNKPHGKYTGNEYVTVLAYIC
jgi:hypothetical protein